MLTLQEKVKMEDAGYASIDDSARTRVAVLVRIGCFSGVKTGVVALALIQERKKTSTQV